MTIAARRPAAWWAGWALSVLVILFMLSDASVALFAPAMIHAQAQETGFSAAANTPLGVIILVSLALYALPATAVLGAILVTGFMGGAICAHFRIGEMGSPPELIALAIGVLAWGGLYLRDPRLRALLPLRR